MCKGREGGMGLSGTDILNIEVTTTPLSGIIYASLS